MRSKEKFSTAVGQPLSVENFRRSSMRLDADGQKSVYTLHSDRRPAVTSCGHQRSTFRIRFSSSGVRLVSITNSQILSGRKTTISLSRKQSLPVGALAVKGATEVTEQNTNPTAQNPEPEFGAFVAIDWAHKKHYFSLQVAGSKR